MIYFAKTGNEIPLNAKQMNFLKTHFSEGIFLEAGKYTRWQDRQAFLGGRYLLFEGLKKFHLSVRHINEIKYTKYNKPYFPFGLNFSISHSGKFVLLAISDQHKIGVDLEKIRHIEIDEFQTFFTDFEYFNINQAQKRDIEFFKYWTIKEAVAKADGRGLSMDLKGITIDKNAYVGNEKWFIKEIKISPDYMAHIAADYFIADEINCDLIDIPEL